MGYSWNRIYRGDIEYTLAIFKRYLNFWPQTKTAKNTQRSRSIGSKSIISGCRINHCLLRKWTVIANAGKQVLFLATEKQPNVMKTKMIMALEVPLLPDNDKSYWFLPMKFLLMIPWCSHNQIWFAIIALGCRRIKEIINEFKRKISEDASVWREMFQW